jgi:hypothetical protein
MIAKNPDKALLHEPIKKGLQTMNHKGVYQTLIKLFEA